MDKSNSTDETRHQDDKHSETGEPPHEAPAPITIDTSDPVIDEVVEHPSDRKLEPDATISVETTQVNESDLLAATGVRTVFADKKQGNSQHRPQDQNGQSKNRGHQEASQQDADRGGDREDRGDDRSRQKQPSMMKSILITAGVALVCGVIGAMGYSYFFGPKSRGPGRKSPRARAIRARRRIRALKRSPAVGKVRSRARGRTRRHRPRTRCPASRRPRMRICSSS